MIAGPRTVGHTIAELFLRMKRNGLRYAVLRNYESFRISPHDPVDHPMTDIDLVMHRQDVPAWRKLAVALAKDCGWDVLTECEHFGESRVAEHRIEIFRFYRLSPPACLQVDIFHGYLLLGVPYDSELKMLEDRFEDPELNLTRVSRSTENAFRMLQLHSLLLDGASEEKIARYRGRVLEYDSGDETGFRSRLRHEFSANGERALNALVKDDRREFRRAMRKSKLYFLARFWLRHPVFSVRCFYERCRDHWMRYIRRPCGFVLVAHAPSERDRVLLRSTLDNLKKRKILPAWTDRGSEQAGLAWPERKVLERGGVAVKWSNSSKGALDITLAADSNELAAAILPRLIARHPALYKR